MLAAHRLHQPVMTTKLVTEVQLQALEMYFHLDLCRRPERDTMSVEVMVLTCTAKEEIERLSVQRDVSPTCRRFLLSDISRTSVHWRENIFITLL
jgi:hypothetical protein